MRIYGKRHLLNTKIFWATGSVCHDNSHITPTDILSFFFDTFTIIKSHNLMTMDWNQILSLFRIAD